MTEAIRSNRVVRAPAEPDDLAQQLIAAGFAPDRAEWINDRSAELMMELIADRNEQLRQNPAATALNMPEQKLRQELGDAEYERYLLALGREPYANILDVIDNSPAATAGLQAGDQIAYYDGRRVFDFLEITPLTMEGTPGEPVIVDIVRDGQPMQLFVPRGPLGLRLGGTPVPIPEPFVPPQ